MKIGPIVSVAAAAIIALALGWGCAFDESGDDPSGNGSANGNSESPCVGKCDSMNGQEITRLFEFVDIEISSESDSIAFVGKPLSDVAPYLSEGHTLDLEVVEDGSTTLETTLTSVQEGESLDYRSPELANPFSDNWDSIDIYVTGEFHSYLVDTHFFVYRSDCEADGGEVDSRCRSEVLDMEGFVAGGGIFVDDDWMSDAELTIEVKSGFSDWIPAAHQIEAAIYLDVDDFDPQDVFVSLFFDGDGEFISDYFDLPDSDWEMLHLEFTGDVEDEILYDVVEIHRDLCVSVDGGEFCPFSAVQY